VLAIAAGIAEGMQLGFECKSRSDLQGAVRDDTTWS